MDLEVIQMIMKHDKFANINDQDTYGNTPLHLAAQNGKAQILSYLLKNYQAELYLKNMERQQPHQCSLNNDTFKVLFLTFNFNRYLWITFRK